MSNKQQPPGISQTRQLEYFRKRSEFRRWSRCRSIARNLVDPCSSETHWSTRYKSIAMVVPNFVMRHCHKGLKYHAVAYCTQVCQLWRCNYIKLSSIHFDANNHAKKKVRIHTKQSVYPPNLKSRMPRFVCSHILT